MTSVQAFQQKVTRSLEIANPDLVPDKLDSHGKMVSWKMQIDQVAFTPQEYSWAILSAIPGTEIYDYFEVVGLDGNEYLTIRFTPGDLPATRTTSIRPNLPKYRKPVKVDAEPKSEKTKAPSSPKSETTPEPIPTITKPTPKSKVILGSYLDNKLTVEAGQIVWTTVAKKDGGLKQARCEVLAVNCDQIDICLTKTRRELSVSVSNLFDHVPHFVNQVWQ